MILNDYCKFPKIMVVKAGDKLDITDCTDDKSVQVYSLIKDGIGDKCTEFSIIKEDEKSILIIPINIDNDAEKYLVKYDKIIAKEEYEKNEQELTSLILKSWY